MAKTRVQKEEILERISENLKDKKSVMVGYSGLSVKDMESLRNSLEEKGVGFFVVKNTLTKIALKKLGIEVDEEILKKPVAMAFSIDEVASAKEIKNFAKTNESIEIYGGIIDSQFVPVSTISALALLPSREELIAKVVGTIAAPISGFVNVLSGNIRGLVSVLNQYQLSKNK